MPVSRRKSPALPKIDRPIVLVGMMGAGKTTVGRRLATALDLPFFDADAEIERSAGMSISELFEKHGEANFRRGETQVIGRLLAGEPIVLATGGGALTSAETRALVKEKAISIWIRADIDTLVKRATRRATRPLLKTGDPKEIISRLLAERTPHYSSADIEIESSAGTHARTVRSIVTALTDFLEGNDRS